MEILPFIINFGLFLTFVVDAVLIFFICLRGEKSLAYYFLVVHFMSILGWTICLFLTLWYSNIFAAKAAFAFALVLAVSKYWFVLVFPENKLPSNKIHYFLVIPAVSMIFISFFDDALFRNFNVINHSYIERGGNGRFSLIYCLLIFFFLMYPLFIVLQKYKKVFDYRIKNQLKFLFLGMSVFFVCGLFTNSILPVFFHIYYFNSLGPIFSLILAAFILYIIRQHDFLHISKFVQHGAIYSILIATAVGLYLFLFYTLGYFLEKSTGIAFLSAIITLTAGMFGASPMEKYLRRKIQNEQKQMMANVSHALQTPLVVMKGGLELLSEQKPSKADFAKKIKFFESSIDDVSKLVYDLLRLAKLEIARDVLKKEKVNISVLLEEILEFFEIAAADKKIAIEKNIEENIYINGDREKLKELSINLLSNAIKYTAHSSGARKIYVILRYVDKIELVIEDTGAGISREDLPHIFEPFYGSDVGLGLAICRKIMERHRGRIKVESELGKGAKFTITFPLPY